jgi:hypothetical protein
MANVKNQDKQLWASLVFAYLFTFIFLYFIDAEYENFAHLRAKYFKGGEDDMSSQMYYSVQIKNIPEGYRTLPWLKEFMDTVFPGEVLHSSVAITLTELEALVIEREELLAKLENQVACWEPSERLDRPKMWLNNSVL